MHALPPWPSVLACACARPFAFTREGEEGQVRLWLPFRDEEPSKKPVAQPPLDLSTPVCVCVCVCRRFLARPAGEQRFFEQTLPARWNIGMFGLVRVTRSGYSICMLESGGGAFAKK